MQYTYQTFSAGYSDPEGTRVRHAENLEELYIQAEAWKEEVERFYDLDSALPSVMVWKGRHKDVTDLYPDFELVYGPRGGVVRRPV